MTVRLQLSACCIVVFCVVFALSCSSLPSGVINSSIATSSRRTHNSNKIQSNLTPNFPFHRWLFVSDLIPVRHGYIGLDV